MTRGWKTIIALSAVALFATAGAAEAQRRGGGGGGGGYRGGSNWGGGGYHNGGYGGYHNGGWGGNSWSIGIGPVYGGYNGWGYGRGYYGGYYGGGYPYYGSNYGYYNSYPYYGDSYGYGYTYPQYSGYSYGYPSSNGYYMQPANGYAMDQSQQYQSESIGTQSMYGDTSRARLRVMVPAQDARLSINGTPMQQTGTSRVFESPALEAGRSYTYSLQATWTENGREVTKQQEVEVRPGQESVAVFRSDNMQMQPGMQQGYYQNQPGYMQGGYIQGQQGYYQNQPGLQPGPGLYPRAARVYPRTAGIYPGATGLHPGPGRRERPEPPGNG